ncbi:hypothetical protein ANO11243_043170 [Dothideomycetidae sp. 11243]|nr:hypothetical protein ANO11243_043170 [fungal sp. No.11243]
MTSPTPSSVLDLPSSPPELAGQVLDLSILPPIFVSLTHFAKDAAEAFEDRLLAHGANVSYDLGEVKIVLTKVERKRRAQFDLRAHGLWTEEVPILKGKSSSRHDRERVDVQDGDASSTEDDVSDLDDSHPDAARILARLNTPAIKIIKVAWMDHCLAAGHFIPIDEYLIFEGNRISPQEADKKEELQTTPKRKRTPSDAQSRPKQPSSPDSILKRARADALETSPRANRDYGIRRFGDKSRSGFTAPYAAGASSSQHIRLIPETTSEHDLDMAHDDAELPPGAEWVTEGVRYACQRVTLANGPNDRFVEILKQIRQARLLTGDEIGVRAYSTSIAAIAAYPAPLRGPRDVLRLPGCDSKIATLFVEYTDTGKVHAADAARDDAQLQVLELFYNIWGVGATTARDFYFSRGWRDLDDVVEFGWSGLSRVQQIGVKYYEEFQRGIPRAEVEGIAKVIHAHAAKVRDARVQSIVVGGYRRGKEICGDVDIVVSHPDLRATKGLVTDIVASLEDEGCITHTLLLALTSTHRDQETLPFRASKTHAGSGFDTLDKALVVWQDPAWSSRAADVAQDPDAKNPAPHRRVDIIVSPWRTVGCAVAGWTSGTTFQRDLRRYAKYVKGWKFDSSGIRERGSGLVVDVEGYYAEGGSEGADQGRGAVGVRKWAHRATTMEEAERRVFASMGLEWREPWERCTG